MIKRIDRNAKRKKRHLRIRKKISGTSTKPRLCVFRSAKNIYAQIIDDISGRTLISASSLDKNFEGVGSNKEAARKVGNMIAEKAKALSINKVVFDRNGYIYHGRIMEFAEGAREGGLEF